MNVPNYNVDYQKASKCCPSLWVGRPDTDQLHLQLQTGAATAYPPQGAAALRQVRWRIIRRDVP